MENEFCDECGINKELHKHTVIQADNEGAFIKMECPDYSANLRQVGGNHYKVGGEEHWDRVHRLGLDYFQACITKYVERWKKKNGVEDLKKAQHYLEKYIELCESEQTKS